MVCRPHFCSCLVCVVCLVEWVGGKSLGPHVSTFSTILRGYVLIECRGRRGYLHFFPFCSILSGYVLIDWRASRV